MKKAALIFVVLMALPLAGLWAQSDPVTPPATDHPANDPYAVQSDPTPAADQPATASPTPEPTDPNAVNDPDADARNLPATASHGPLILMMGLLAIGMFLVLKVFRRRSVDLS